MLTGYGDILIAYLFVLFWSLNWQEDILFYFDPLHYHISEDLHEHIDGCHSKGLFCHWDTFYRR